MIELKNVTFSYNDKKRNIVENLNLRVEQGYVHGLLGKNGTGKTTLLKLICGLLFPDNGEIKIDDFTPKQRKTAFLSEVFFLPEEFEQIKISIETYARINSKFYPKFSQADFEHYLEEFEITDLRQKLSKLSYGTKKKVLIAFGLATHVSYMFLDEPTNGLDIPSKSQFRKIVLKAMNEQTTIIISTHQVRDLHNLIDNIIIMDKASILLNANTDTITQKLWFGLEDRNEGDIIYKEETIGGSAVVSLNSNDKESNLDIELLFNAAFTNKDKFNEIFTNNK
jgi:ABC-2 type transport system ATP-binding protein